MRLANQVALITGGGQGIGLACALAYVREGAAVALVDFNPEAGPAALQAVEAAGGRALLISADVSQPAQMEAAVQETRRALGEIDVLICSAGIGGRKLGDGPVHTCTPAAWDKILSVNLGGTFLACRAVLPGMLERRRGSIITLSSVLGLVGTQGLFDTHAYATSKAGIIGLTRSIAAHYAREGIRANVIAPGLVDTQMAARTKATPALAEQVAFWQPLGGLGQPQDVAAAAVFLGSEEAKFITGVVLPVDGGWTAQ